MKSNNAQDASFWETVEDAAKPEERTINALLSPLVKLVDEKHELEKEIAKLEVSLKDRKEELRKLDQEEIPAMLQEAGIDSIRVPGVGTVSYDTEYKASIKAEHWPEFKEWAKNNGFEDVLKEQTVITNADPGVLLLLERASVDFSNEPAMHWQTLAKVARTLAAEGKEFPSSLGVFSYYKTKVKK